MRIARAAPAPASDVSLIPMINVVFLLLIFFLVAGTIRTPELLDVTPPQSTHPAGAPHAPRTLHLAADGSLALDGVALDATLLRSALDVGIGAVGQDTSPAGSAAIDPVAALALRADAATRFATLRDTLDVLRAAGVRKIELITVHAPAGRR